MSFISTPLLPVTNNAAKFMLRLCLKSHERVQLDRRGLKQMAITNQKLVKFFDSARQRKFSKGEIVLSGENPSGVMCIKDGFVQVYSISDEGDRYVHILYKAGELFPLIWVLQNIRRRIFYEAVSDVVVAEASKENFIDYRTRRQDYL
jgi:CRP-like cAMP-binding protein